MESIEPVFFAIFYYLGGVRELFFVSGVDMWLDDIFILISNKGILRLNRYHTLAVLTFRIYWHSFQRLLIVIPKMLIVIIQKIQKLRRIKNN